ncbi:IPT/TIG domain-containing protein [Paractinoplanes toevensis]|uniref:IPT/TIG domain-containing protein n=1 Tax=Paractinoplanes toevensis TaxID=571911 RepID=A0A919WCN7_9ACTN|nr:IPT/TIG domain-containing protein [Actinoplanes toevensis]GIM97775.1 hypothetical protein Ato02nite_095680 [Actinoplanes toevensis]
MRKSKSFARSRLAVAAGLSTGAVAAALLVAPNAAFAAVSISKTIAAPTDVVTVTDTTATPFTAATSVVELQSTACNAKYQTTSASVLAPTISGTQTTSVVAFVVPTAAAGANGQLKKWFVCVYAGNTVGTSSLQNTVTSGANANNWTLSVGYVPTLSPAAGITGGGDVVTITPQASYPIFTGVTTVGAIFASGTECPAAYGTPTANTTATVTKNADGSATVTTPAGVTSTTGLMSPYQVCLYNGAAGSSTLISQAAFNAGQLQLSQNTGPYGGNNGLNITSPNQFLAGVDTPGVYFQSIACQATYTTPAGIAAGGNGGSVVGGVAVAANKTRKLTDSRLAVTVPPLFTNAPDASQTWNLCVYNGQTVGSALIASGMYTLTTVPSATGVSPKAGPALGGSKIVVTGTALPIETGKITATLGGVALTDITPINATAFSAKTPQHAPANNVALVLTTDAGSFTLSNAYSYTAALRVSPNTAPNTKAVDVVVNGVGFQSANWQTGLLTGSHFVLARGSYDPSAVSANRANPPVAECGNVLVLTDTEAICTLDLTKRLLSDGSDYAASVAPVAIATSGSTAGSRVLTDSAHGFTNALVGTVVTGTNIPAGTTVARYIDVDNVLLSNNATGTGTITATFSAPSIRSLTVTSTGTGSKVVTATAGTFAATDVGKTLAVAGMTADTIATYTDSTHVELTSNASALVTGAAADVLSLTLPVPEGAYNLTYVSNTAVGANGSDATYIQSMISSGSTFTVSSF